MNTTVNHEIEIIDLGRIDYAAGLEFQTRLFDEILTVKKENRERHEDDQLPTKNYLIFCEHPHVFTLGKSGEEKNLLLEKRELEEVGATYFHINRGGDITYHGEGQIVVYPILDLENFFTDIHRYMRLLEESVILTLKDYHLEAGRIPGLTGVWLGANEMARKICALGVKSSRWVTLHGLAFNVNTDLHYFDYIVPCGISDKAVTSLEKELGKKQDMDEVKSRLQKHLLDLLHSSVS